jgi:hypothetical protein
LGFSQETGLGKPHNSYFKKHKQGVFNGTVNGIISLRTQNNDTLLLDFQAGKALLDIEHDPEEMYDVSTKNFVGFTTSGKTQITYLTYASANMFHLYLSGKRYVAGIIDGAADLVILGLNYHYFKEKGTEYLSLYFEKQVVFRKEDDRKKTVVVLAGSSVVFAIQTKNAP